jgi:Rne/Rng family ribonuclease
MMPGMENFGVSRKIEDEKERRRLRKILDELDPIEGVGFIIRTAGMGKTKADIEKDLKYLTRLWETISKISTTTKAPVELYTEGDLVTRTVRDVYGTDIDRIVIDSKEVGRRVKDFVKLTAPRGKTKVELHKDPIPLFHAYGIEREIEMIHSRHVPLPSGGSLVIDSTEAVVAIDVNSGKFREHSDAETTAFKTDMEAADEIPRQLKLRDLGGVIICDFIDLRFERHRRQLEQRLFDNFKNDKAKTRVLRMSEFGIIEITRQRMRPSLKRSIYSDCPHCRGHGLVKTPESMALDVMRKLAIAVHDERVVRVQLGVCAEVAFFLGNRRRKQLSELEEETGKPIEVRSLEGVGLDELRLDLFDDRDTRVLIGALGMVAEGQDRPQRHGGGRSSRGGGGGGGGGSGGGRGDHRHRGQQRPAEQQMDDEEGDGDRRDEPQGGRDRGRPQPSAEARRDRPEDRIRPIGIEPLRDGAGHRGPRVVQEQEFEDDEGLAGDAAAEGLSGDVADMASGDESEGSDSNAAQQGETGEGTGRRRRRRRRGGRGRRRNRGGDEFSAPNDGSTDPSAEDAEDDDETMSAESEAEAGEDERSLPVAEREPDRFDDGGFEDSVGRAPTAIGDEPESAADEEAPAASGGSAEPAGEDSAAPAPRRGRGRGGRGRGGRGRQTPEAISPAEVESSGEPIGTVPVADEPVAASEDADRDAPGAEEESRGGRGPRRRGGRGRGRGGKDSGPAEASSASETLAPQVRAEVAEKRVPPPSQSERRGPAVSSSTTAAPARRMPTPVNVPGPLRAPTPVAVPPPLPGAVGKAKTADKHLADDEPVDPQPLRRPKSYGDLDAIPDDLD